MKLTKSNEIKIYNDFAIIVLYDKKSNPIAETIIDIEDKETVRKYEDKN